MNEKEQWYSNKDLYEMIDKLKAEMGNLTHEISNTTKLIKNYNGLREKMNEFENELIKMKTNKENDKDFKVFFMDMFKDIFRFFMKLLTVSITGILGLKIADAIGLLSKFGF